MSFYVLSLKSMNRRYIIILVSKGGLLCLVSFLLLSSMGYSFPYNGLDIKIKGAVGEMYDDNITSAIDGNKKEDFITKLTLGKI